MDTSSDIEMQSVSEESHLFRPSRISDVVPPAYSTIDNPNCRCKAECSTVNPETPQAATKSEVNKKEQRTLLRHRAIVAFLLLFLLSAFSIVAGVRGRNKTFPEQAQMKEMQVYVGCAFGAALGLLECSFRWASQDFVFREYVPVLFVMALGVANLMQCTFWIGLGDRSKSE